VDVSALALIRTQPNGNVFGLLSLAGVAVNQRLSQKVFPLSRNDPTPVDSRIMANLAPNRWDLEEQPVSCHRSEVAIGSSAVVARIGDGRPCRNSNSSLGCSPFLFDEGVPGIHEEVVQLGNWEVNQQNSVHGNVGPYTARLRIGMPHQQLRERVYSV
jgi:hypothetical protein